MEGSKVVDVFPNPHEEQLELGFQSESSSTPLPHQPDLDSPPTDHDPPSPPPIEREDLHEQFQSLDLKESVGNDEKDEGSEEIIEKHERTEEIEKEEDDKYGLSDGDVGIGDGEEKMIENDKNGWSDDGGVYDDGEIKIENDENGWSDDGKKIVDEDEKDGWSDDLVDNGKKIDEEVEKDGWSDDRADYEKKSENDKDGWNDYQAEFEKKSVDDNVGWSDENIGETEDSTLMEDTDSRYQFPLRPDAEDCSFYVRTGACKFGPNCKFNHPIKRKNQGMREKVKGREQFPENPGQIECKYYLTSGGCKYGKACRYNHARGKTSILPVLEYNFLGLPIRPGERECPYYMRTGSCKYAANCRFNHPDPTGGSDPPSGYVNGGSLPLQGVSQPTVPSWSSSRTLSETAPYVPMMYPSPQGISPQNPEWSGYQAPAYQPERSMHPSAAFIGNNPAAETSVYTHHQQHMLVEEFPQRPGQPECSYFLKTGDCKYRSNCKYHHPKNRISKLPPVNVTDKGLPLRPDQNICVHYSRYGICKFGPNCKFDHPTNIGSSVSSAVSGPDQTTDGARFGGSAIYQSV